MAFTNISDLRKLRIDLTFWTGKKDNSGRPLAFITKVTKLIALKRMAFKDFYISCDL